MLGTRERGRPFGPDIYIISVFRASWWCYPSSYCPGSPGKSPWVVIAGKLSLGCAVV